MITPSSTHLVARGVPTASTPCHPRVPSAPLALAMCLPRPGRRDPQAGSSRRAGSDVQGCTQTRNHSLRRLSNISWCRITCDCPLEQLSPEVCWPSSTSPSLLRAILVPRWLFTACGSMSLVGLGSAVDVSSEDTGLWTPVCIQPSWRGWHWLCQGPQQWDAAGAGGGLQPCRLSHGSCAHLERVN